MDAFFRTLPGLIEAMEGSEEVRDAFIFAAWRRIAGAQIVERTEPVEFADGVIAIAVEDRSWQKNIETLAPQLLFKLNAALKNVPIKRIEFRIDPNSLAKRRPAKTNPNDAAMVLPEELAASLNDISSERLRNAVKGAAENCLARK